MIRSFIAIEIPSDIQSELRKVLNHFKDLTGKISWTKPEGIHITLKFLGDIQEALIEVLRKNLERLATDYRAFPLVLTGIGAFPNTTYPRVIWVGIQDASGTLIKMQRRLEKDLQPLGFVPEERDFSLHLTLGRVKSLQSKGEFLRKINTLPEFSVDTFVAEKVNLMKSQLTPSGAIYTALVSVPLCQ